LGCDVNLFKGLFMKTRLRRRKARLPKIAKFHQDKLSFCNQPATAF